MKTTEQKVEILIGVIKFFRPFLSMILSSAQIKQFDELVKDLNS